MFGPKVLKILKFRLSYFCSFVSKEKKGVVLNLKQLKSPLPEDALICAKFGLNWSSGSGEKDFKILSMYFRYIVIISPWEKAPRLFIWTNLNSLHPIMFRDKFG